MAVTPFQIILAVAEIYIFVDIVEVGCNLPGLAKREITNNIAHQFNAEKEHSNNGRSRISYRSFGDREQEWHRYFSQHPVQNPPATMATSKNPSAYHPIIYFVPTALRYLVFVFLFLMFFGFVIPS